jgi:hypothetical protein
MEHEPWDCPGPGLMLGLGAVRFGGQITRVTDGVALLVLIVLLSGIAVQGIINWARFHLLALMAHTRSGNSRELPRNQVSMTEIYVWLQKTMGGDETRATIVAASVAIFAAVVLGVAIYYGMAAVLDRLPAVKDRCPGCGRRSLTVCWFDENDEEGVEYVFSRCSSCAARYKQRPYGAWEGASEPKFDAVFNRAAAGTWGESLWDRDLDA